MVASEQGDPVVRVFYPGRDPEPDPRLRRELRMDQLEAIYRITREITDPDRSGSVLVGAGMGSGKTVVSVEVILKTKPKRCLIVGVRDAYGQWRDAREHAIARGSAPVAWATALRIAGPL